MLPRITAACRESGQQPPDSPAEVIRSILLSLACKHRLVLDLLAHVSGRGVSVVHLVGGGTHNQLLCQLTADITGLPLLAGPAEASAIGNVLVQARSQGAFDSLDEMRNCARRSFPPQLYEPTAERDVYERFLALTRAADRVPVYER
jgi:rhamnulokinase